MTGQLFTDPAAPRVFGLPPGSNFAADFVAGLRQRAGGDPVTLARTQVYVNTERTRRRLREVFEADAVGLTPRLSVLSEIPGMVAGTPPALPPLKRRLELAVLVRSLLDRIPDLAPRAASFDLAEGLATLLGEMQTEGVPFAALEGIDTGDGSGHWERSLSFLQIIAPVLEAEDPAALDPEARLRWAMVTQAALWRKSPPDAPVIVAGSTGSRGATAIFLDAVARLPQGAVVLPALDPHLPGAVWDMLDDGDTNWDHPQFGLGRLGRTIGFDPAATPVWIDRPEPSASRNRLISLALRPAPVTDQWLSDGPALIPELADATRGLTLIEARDPLAEAQAIAVRMRQAVDDGQTVALITPDRVLARRVTACLDRWNIAPDDSAGRPLGLTPPGVFLRLVAAGLSRQLTPVALVEILKHPLCAQGGDFRAAHSRHIARLELDYFPEAPPFIDWPKLQAWADRAGQDIARWARWLAGLFGQHETSAKNLSDLVDRHLRTAETLAAGPEVQGSGPLWEEEAGEKARRIMDDLVEHAPHGGHVTPAEYQNLLAGLLRGEDVPDAAYTPRSDVAIWGTLEARTQTADVMILGGLNEGVWPGIPQPDHWLSRRMRLAAGLPLPERRIGLSAHDFQHAVGATQVVLTRPLRDGEAPTVAARWIMRLTNLLGGLGDEGVAALRAMRDRGAQVVALADALDPPDPGSVRAHRPAPAPPVDARPRELPVTAIERLIRDPYAVYARYVLRLRKREGARQSADHLLRGESYHAVLERFVEETRDGLGPDPAATFSRIAAEVLAEAAPWPAIRKLWAARLALFANRFLPAEALRRLDSRPLRTEARGRTDIPQTPVPFCLTARADRIDLAANGHLRIYDYKGAPGSEKMAKAFAKQLPLEAGIAVRGGFEGIAATSVDHLELIGTGTKDESVILDAEAEEIAETWDRMIAFISTYQDAATPYAARLRPHKLTFEGDYDHLSRRGEWDDGDEFTAEAVG